MGHEPHEWCGHGAILRRLVPLGRFVDRGVCSIDSPRVVGRLQIPYEKKPWVLFECQPALPLVTLHFVPPRQMPPKAA